MAVAYKICVDCADPHRLAAFWAEAMGYVVEDHSALIQRLLDAGQVTEAARDDGGRATAWRHAAAVRDPDAPVDPVSGIGQGGRVLFQVVPEPKTVKNRVHLDLHVGLDQRTAVVQRLTGLGGSVLYEKARRLNLGHDGRPGGERVLRRVSPMWTLVVTRTATAGPDRSGQRGEHAQDQRGQAQPHCRGRPSPRRGTAWKPRCSALKTSTPASTTQRTVRLSSAAAHGEQERPASGTSSRGR